MCFYVFGIQASALGANVYNSSFQLFDSDCKFTNCYVLFVDIVCLLELRANFDLLTKSIKRIGTRGKQRTRRWDREAAGTDAGPGGGSPSRCAVSVGEHLRRSAYGSNAASGYAKPKRR